MYFPYSHAYAASMHLALEFIDELNEDIIHNLLLNQGIPCNRLSHYYLEKPEKYGLVLGFANSSKTEINSNVSTLAGILNKAAKPVYSDI